MTRWDLVYKWADPKTRSIVDAVTSALENCDRKLTEAEARSTPDAALREQTRITVERRGLRITGQQIRDALKVLGPTGDRAEAYVKTAALGMADLLDEVAALPRTPGEDR